MFKTKLVYNLILMFCLKAATDSDLIEIISNYDRLNLLFWKILVMAGRKDCNEVRLKG